MKRVLTILSLLFFVILSFGQDIKPISPNFKPLQSPSFSYYVTDSTVWIYKGATYGWTKLTSERDVLKLIKNAITYYNDTVVCCGIEEAPINGIAYVRKDGSWIPESGGGGSSSEILNEVPSGSVNNSNTLFILSTLPITNTERVYLNGIRQKTTLDYFITGQNITFATPPYFNDLITVDYLITISTTKVFNEVPSGAIDNSNTIFTLTNSVNDSKISLYLNGVRQKYGIDYSVSGNIITFVEPPYFGDIIIVDYEKL